LANKKVFDHVEESVCLVHKSLCKEKHFRTFPV